MGSNAFLPQQNRFRRRTFRQRIALIVATCLLAISSWSQSTNPGQEMPDREPTREWLGPEYAETVFALMRTRHPEIDLKIDVNDLAVFQKQSPSKERVKKAVEEFRQTDPNHEMTLQHRLMDFARNILPGAYKDLVWQLEAGNSINLSQKQDHQYEKELLEWILSRPDQSLSPDQLMEQALVKTNGRVLAAWVITWNAIRAGWAAAATRNYGFMQKFISLTGERHLWKSSFNYIAVPPNEKLTGQASIFVKGDQVSEGEVPRHFKMIVTKRGDDFSYLYHRLGVELLSMIIAKQTGFSQLGRAGGSVGAFGEWFKFRQTSGLKGENEKRVSNDYTAAASGAHFYLLVENKAQSRLTAQQIHPSVYLKTNSKKYGKKYLLPDDRPSSYFNSNADPMYWKESMSVLELTQRFFHATRYDENIFNPVILAGGEDYERLHRGLRDYLQSPEQSKELNQYMQDYLNGMRGTPAVQDVQVDTDLFYRPAGDNWKFASQADPNFNFNEYGLRLERMLTRILAVKNSLPQVQTIKKKALSRIPIRCEKAHAG